MKKLIWILVLLLCFGGLVYAGINTSWTSVRGNFPRIDIALNVQANSGGIQGYYPAQIIVAGRLLSADNGEKVHVYKDYLGAWQEASYTPKEIYTLMGNASVPTKLQAAVKEWWKTGIDLDPSV